MNGSIVNCVGAVDGYLMAINVPSRSEVGNVRSYFSGHYQKYGLNIQAVCDSSCMFTYFVVSGPGSTNDRVAIHHILDGLSLHQRIEALPGTYVIAADAAYAPTEHLVPVFYGAQRKNVDNDNFNFCLSQCRIRIEMSFGMMQAKWRILRSPLEGSLERVRLIANAISRLHNFVIKQQHNCIFNEIRKAIEPDSYEGTTLNEDNDPQLPLTTDDEVNQFAEISSGVSRIRDAMVERVRRSGCVRPLPNMIATEE